MTDPYPYRRPPLAHQRAFFEATRDRPHAPLFYEQRTGKSKIIVDTVAYSWLRKDIDAFMVIAPNGVNHDWITEHLPLDLPVSISWRGVTWVSSRVTTARGAAELEELLAFDGLACLAVNVEALNVDNFKRYVGRFLRRRRCLVAIDESDCVSDRGAKRSKVVRAIARYAPIRRILTGTPVDESPIDLYAQLEFLSPDILGFPSFYAYRAFVAVYASERTRGGRTYPKLLGYRNLDAVGRKLAAAYPGVQIRLTRREVAAGPEKLYVKRRFELTAVQRRVYDDLRASYLAELRGAEVVTAAHVLTRLTRLQQVASNRVPIDLDAAVCVVCGGGDPDCDACDGIGFIAPTAADRLRVVDPAADPRFDALVAELRLDPVATIVWARFRSDVSLICEAAVAVGLRVARYDGGVSAADRVAATAAFQDGSVDVIALTLSVRRGGRGLRLSRAGKIVYYSNGFSLRVRGQSEDRAEDLDKVAETTVVDLIAVDTVDERIVQALREKRSVSDAVLGDDPREWL